MFGDDVMLIPRDGEMNYEKLDDLNFYYMFLGSCLSQNEIDCRRYPVVFFFVTLF